MGVTKAQDAEPFQRREIRVGSDKIPVDVVQQRSRDRQDDNIPGFVNFASDPRTFAAGGAVVALSFVLYASVYLSGGSTTARVGMWGRSPSWAEIISSPQKWRTDPARGCGSNHLFMSRENR